MVAVQAGCTHFPTATSFEGVCYAWVIDGDTDLRTDVCRGRCLGSGNKTVHGQRYYERYYSP